MSLTIPSWSRRGFALTYCHSWAHDLMMDLSTDFIQGLQLMGNDSVIDDALFETVLRLAVESILLPDTLGRATSCGLDKVEAKLGLAGVVAFLVEAVKLDRNGTDLRHMLEDLHLIHSRQEEIIKTYDENKAGIKLILSNISRSHPHINDVQWRAEYYIKNNHLHKVGGPQYQIQLQTQKPGRDDSEMYRFFCSQEQLQDMVAKLKEACKGLERAHQSTPS